MDEDIEMVEDKSSDENESDSSIEESSDDEDVDAAKITELTHKVVYHNLTNNVPYECIYIY